MSESRNCGRASRRRARFNRPTVRIENADLIRRAGDKIGEIPPILDRLLILQVRGIPRI